MVRAITVDELLLHCADSTKFVLIQDGEYNELKDGTVGTWFDEEEYGDWFVRNIYVNAFCELIVMIYQ